MKVLFYRWNSYMNRGIIKAFKQLDIEYEELFYQQGDWEQDEEFEGMLRDVIDSSVYDAVFSVNFAPIVSKVCEERGVRYVSWVYDSPLHIRNLEPMKNSCNDIYLFDRGQVEEYQKMGYPVKHMPLAVDTDDCKVPTSAAERKKYTSEVSLVGKLYQTEYGKYTAPLSEYMRGYLGGIVNAQSKINGGCIIPDMITEDLLDKINKEYEALGTTFRMGKRELEFMLCSEVTGRDRYIALSILAKHFDTHLYSAEDPNIESLNFGGTVDYGKEMPIVFQMSKINLNISLRAIRTGMPLRVLDVMGSGGFLMSNYQVEVVENFELGRECEVYENIEDLYAKTKFYLEHDDVRRQIAQNGLERVKRDFTFKERIEKMLFRS